MSSKSRLTMWIIGSFVVGLLVGVFAFGGGVSRFGNVPIQYDNQWFYAIVRITNPAGGSGVGLRLGGDNAANQVNKWLVATSSLGLTNFGPIGTTTSTVTFNISVSSTAGSATVNDICSANLPSVTSTIPFNVSCWISSAGTSTITFTNVSSTAVTIPTTTIRVLDQQTQL